MCITFFFHVTTTFKYEVDTNQHIVVLLVLAMYDDWHRGTNTLIRQRFRIRENLFAATFFFSCISFLWPYSHFREQTPLTDEQLVAG